MTADTPRDDTDFLRRVDTLFERALDLGIEDRSAFLDGECADDPQLRERVELLLRASEDTGGRFLPGGAQEHGLYEIETDESNPEADLERIDRYQLIEEVGRGGMGVVYRAQRADGAFEQTVAVKVLRSSAGASTEARFARERQILATLDHPNIARLLDGGVTKDQRPYLVVEFVEGRQLDEVCRDDPFDLEARLRLLIRLCDAVESAHHRLVVHRDIKPGNIIVRDDGEPKLLDFGIAKLIRTGGDPDLTKAQQRVMTLQYASPEQVRGVPVTVASDVYQLGLVAYEVLCGVRPYELHSTPPATAERLITEEEPPPPSTNAATPERRRRLEGDLDLVVMKALRKDVSQRYETAAQLRDDLRAYLDGRPVHARPLSWSYRASKFAQRNLAAVSVAALLGFLLVAATLVFTLRLIEERDRTQAEAERANQQEQVAVGALDEAERSLDFFVELLSWEAGPEFASQGTIQVERLLEQGVVRAESLNEYPRAKARSLWTLGTIAQMWGDLEEAQAVQAGAVEYIEEQLEAGFEPSELEPTLAQLLLDLGEIETARGFGEEGLRLQQRGVELVRRWFSEDSDAVGSARMRLAISQVNHGRAEDAIENARAAVEALQKNRQSGDQDIVSARRIVGDALVSLGRYGEARDHLSPLVVELERDLPGTLWLASAANALGNALSGLGDFEAAVVRYKQADEIAQAVVPAGHPILVGSAWGLGDGLRKAGKLEEALAVQDIGLEQARRGKLDYFGRRLELARAVTLADLGKLDEALDAVAVLDWLRERTDDPSSLGTCEYDAALVYEAAGRQDDARDHFLRSLELVESERGSQHASLAWPLLGLARVHTMDGEWTEAAAFARRALEVLDAVAPLESPARVEALETWLGALRAGGDEAGAAAGEALRRDRVSQREV